ncbi:MAG: hypothetical protein A2826_00085 [Candidatus Doudnabacteria bacterium RIFCSPHIGHO2_01_FULL_43_23]|uniref:Nudix hydrolase domain-containing protein n=1 Tax=Candidatus Doudnabacteria bacterium RIFCSPHIGHO2_01_FULL_43_23 TaxID=1817822 RepID=A0A1F5NQH5_9BACT|nr:MAG: hypothetical protein A2826_00085 [Candidatus Doudnabacteria bacterium RIFCSPHIGHO2_01_FULL_43_23]
MTEVTAGLTAKEERTLISLLGKIGQPWSQELYLAICPHLCLTATETVFIKKIGGVLFVLLPDRNANDPNWAGLPHSPGSMLRGTDTKGKNIDGFADPISRACREIGVDPKQVTIGFADFITQQTARGPELGMVFACTTSQEPKKGAWYPINCLPGSIILHHIAIIEIAKKQVEENPIRFFGI